MSTNTTYCIYMFVYTCTLYICIYCTCIHIYIRACSWHKGTTGSNTGMVTCALTFFSPSLPLFSLSLPLFLSPPLPLSPSPSLSVGSSTLVTKPRLEIIEQPKSVRFHPPLPPPLSPHTHVYTCTCSTHVLGTLLRGLLYMYMWVSVFSSVHVHNVHFQSAGLSPCVSMSAGKWVFPCLGQVLGN